MKQRLFGAVLGTLLVASQLAANPIPHRGEGECVFSMQAGLRGGYSFSHGGQNLDTYDDKHFPVVEGTTRVSIPTESGFTIQLDFDGFLGINSRSPGNGEDNLQNFFFTTGHMNWRSVDRGFVGLLFGYGESRGGESEDAQVWFVGPEGLLFFDEWTFGGQFGFMDADDEDEGDVMSKAWWMRGILRYFFDSNSCIQAEGLYASGEEPVGGADKTGGAWGLRYTRALEGRPFSWYVEYFGTHTHHHDSNNRSVTDHGLEFGFELTFSGANSVEDEMHRGIVIDGPARAFGHLTGWSMEVAD